MAASEARCTAVLIKEYGVIHITDALTEDKQKELWNLTKPRVADPAGRATGFSNFQVSAKHGKGKPEPRSDSPIAKSDSIPIACPIHVRYMSDTCPIESDTYPIVR